MSIKQYHTVMSEHFPPHFFMGFTENPNDVDLLQATEAQVCLYEKVTWSIPNDEGTMEEKGLRYGENPGQEAALYRPINGNIILAGLEFIHKDKGLIGALDTDCLIQFGKHPSKTNLTDIDSGLNILKYFSQPPCAIIIKHNNACGAAIGDSLLEAYTKAWEADPIAPFGGTLVINRPLDKDTAEALSEQYYEVVCAPDYEEGTTEILARRKNLRVVRMKNIERLHEHLGQRYLDIKSLSDGSIIQQWSYVPTAGKENTPIKTFEDFAHLVDVPKDVPEREMQNGKLVRTGNTVSVNREPTQEELKDLWFAWMVETGVTSNSVLTAKNGATVSIGVGGQDRVMMAKQCVSKAYDSRRALISIQKHGMNYDALLLQVRDRVMNTYVLDQIDQEVEKDHAGLEGAVAASDAFFPFRDGVDALLDQGIKAIVQPGGSLRDSDAIKACNENNATMLFTGMRCFKH